MSSSRVDAHHHVWDRELFPQTWIGADDRALDRDFSFEDIRPLAAAAGVTATVVIQSIHSTEQTSYLLQLATVEPLLAGVVGWTDLEAPDLADRLAEWRDGPGGDCLVGIRHLVQFEPDPNWLDGPAVRRGLATLAEAGLVFDLVIKPPQLAAAVRVVHALPQLTFVLDHLGKPRYKEDLTQWATGIHAMAAAPNVTCKISGLVTELDWARCSAADVQPAVDVVRSAFGPERLLFGTDWPVCTIQAPYAEVVALAETLMQDSTPDELDGYFGENARAIYGLRSAADDPAPYPLGGDDRGITVDQDDDSLRPHAI